MCNIQDPSTAAQNGIWLLEQYMAAADRYMALRTVYGGSDRYMAVPNGTLELQISIERKTAYET